MGRIRLRRFRSADSQALAALIASTLRASNAGDYPPQVIARIEEELSSERLPALAVTREIFVALDARTVVGTGSLQRDWIQALFVHPERQREGIGRLLAHRLETLARARGTTRVHLYSTLSAVGFYQVLGFEIHCEHCNERYGHVVEMSKSLALRQAQENG